MVHDRSPARTEADCSVLGEVWLDDSHRTASQSLSHLARSTGGGHWSDHRAELCSSPRRHDMGCAIAQCDRHALSRLDSELGQAGSHPLSACMECRPVEGLLRVAQCELLRTVSRVPSCGDEPVATAAQELSADSSGSLGSASPQTGPKCHSTDREQVSQGAHVALPSTRAKERRKASCANRVTRAVATRVVTRATLVTQPLSAAAEPSSSRLRSLTVEPR